MEALRIRESIIHGSEHAKVIEIRHVKKAFNSPNFHEVFTDVNLDVRHGELVALTGPVGSGKTTLLNLISGFLKPDSGFIFINGREISKMNSNELTSFRSKTFGIVPQVQRLIDEFSVWKNVELPLIFVGVKDETRRKLVSEALEKIGIISDSDRKVGTLSCGERQLVSIARAIVHDPKILLMDEPTEALDPLVSELILEMLKGEALLKKRTILIATHDKKIIAQASKIVRVGRKMH